MVLSEKIQIAQALGSQVSIVIGAEGFTFNTPRDVFTGVDLEAARTERDAYFATPAGVAALVDFQDEPSLAIILRPDGALTRVFETYQGGQMGMPYSNTLWVAVTIETPQIKTQMPTPTDLAYTNVALNAWDFTWVAGGAPPVESDPRYEFQMLGGRVTGGAVASLILGGQPSDLTPHLL